MLHMHEAAPPALTRRTLNLAVLAACAALAQPAGAEILEFTGNAPVYTARWYNGVDTEFHEFQYYLDWQGYCNAHFGATCASTTFWGVSFNWDANRPPGLADDVYAPAGSVVVISSYDSVYKGWIPGSASAGTLTAEGQIRLGQDGVLRADNGTIADLYLGGGTMETEGLVIVNNLSQALGSLQGSGTTRVMGATGAFDPFIRAGHSVEFYGMHGGSFGGSFGSTGPWLEPGARLVNHGTLEGAKLMLQGLAYFDTLPRLVNRGTLAGGLDPGSVGVDNEGTVTLAGGGVMDFGPAGAHTGSFTAAANSVFTFGGLWGHELMPASSLSSAGKVVFQAGVHKVRGAYATHETELRAGGQYVYLDFTGSDVNIDTLRAEAGSGQLRFLTAAGVNLQELSLTSGNVAFDAGVPGAKQLSTIQSLIMTGGQLTAESPVDLVNPFEWNVGNIAGGGGFTARGGIEISASTALNRGLYGLMRNPGTVNWHGGILNWGGTFENLAGANFNLHGDFSAGSGGLGRFVNAGNLYKTAGSGVATLGMAFDNGGLVQVQAGILQLNGGGAHDRGHFEALPGARIELSGGTVMQGAVTTAGRVDITGGGMTLLGGASYTNAAGNSISVSDLTNAGTLNNIDVLNITGNLSSKGSFRNDGANAWATISGPSSSITGNLHNGGSLQFLGGDVEFDGTGTNLGQIYNGGGSFTMLAGAALGNHGTMTNDGGTVFVEAGALLGGSGSYVQTGGLTRVRGVLQADAGIDIQGGILRGGTPPGSPPGVGTVIGNVWLHGQSWRWEPGNSPGTFTVVGDVLIQGNAFPLPGEGNLEIEFDSPTAHDRIVVSGTLSLHAASIDLVFAPGFTALDGDSLEWLSAGQVELPNGPETVVYNVTGLSTDWQVTPTFGASGASLDMVNLLAVPIPASGSHAVALGEQAYNDSWASLDGLSLAGNLSNRTGGSLAIESLNVEASGRLLNRGTLQTGTQLANAGELINRRDGQFWHGGVLNTGSLLNEGQLSGEGDVVNQGRVVNSGGLQVGAFTNAAATELINEGEFSHSGQFANETGGRVESHGTMTADGQVVNRGAFFVSGHLQNNASTFGPAYRTGSILNADGGAFTVEAGGTVSGPGTYFQSHDDSVTRVDGTLAASDITLLKGVLAGDGTLVGPVSLGAASGFGATVRPGNSPGTLTVDGDLHSYYARFEIELAGPALFDRIAVTGDAQFTGSMVNFLLHTPDGISFDYLPSAGDSFTWLTVGGAVDGLAGLNWNLILVGEGWYSTVASSYWGVAEWNGLQIGFQGDRLEFTAAAVPEHETWVMMLAGLGLVGWIVRRRGTA